MGVVRGMLWDGAGGRASAMQRVFFSMKRVMYQLRWRFWAGLRKQLLPVTPAQYEVLRILDGYEYGLPRFKLVRLLGVSGPVVSRMLGVLEKKGFIERTRIEQNRRQVIVTLTSHGSCSSYGLHPKGPDFCEWMDAEIRASFTSSDERAGTELELLERYLWRARYNNDETSPLLDPFEGGEVVGYSGWVKFPPPPPLAFVLAA